MLQLPFTTQSMKQKQQQQKKINNEEVVMYNKCHHPPQYWQTGLSHSHSLDLHIMGAGIIIGGNFTAAPTGATSATASATIRTLYYKPHFTQLHSNFTVMPTFTPHALYPSVYGYKFFLYLI